MDIITSAAGFYIIASQHCDNPNISPRFVCQATCSVSDKNNGVPGPSPRCQSAEQTHDKDVSSAEGTIKMGGGPLRGQMISRLGLMAKDSELSNWVFPVQPSFVITARLQRKRWPRSTNGIWHKENSSRLLLIKATLVESVIVPVWVCSIRQRRVATVQTVY